MEIPAVLRQKSIIIQNCLGQIKKITNGEPSSLDDLLIQDAFVLNVQRCVQAAIDISNWVCRDKKLGVPNSYRKSFELLSLHKIIDSAFSDNLVKMCGFRNIAIYDYKKLKIEILKSILTKELKDLELFYINIIQYYNTTINP